MHTTYSATSEKLCPSGYSAHLRINQGPLLWLCAVLYVGMFGSTAQQPHVHACQWGVALTLRWPPPRHNLCYLCKTRPTDGQIGGMHVFFPFKIKSCNFFLR